MAVVPSRSTVAWPSARVTTVTIVALVIVIVVLLVVIGVVVSSRRAASSPASRSMTAARSHPMHALPPLLLPPEAAEIPLLPLPRGTEAAAAASSLRGGGYRFEEYPAPPAGALDLRTRVAAPIPVYDQLYGDCPEQATAFLVEYMSAREHGRAFRPSRLLLSFDSTRFESVGQPQLLRVLQRTLGGPDTTVDHSGRGNPTHCAATLLLRGMVDERLYPYPTASQFKAHRAAIGRARAALEAVRPLGARPSAAALSRWRAQVERALAADGAYLRALARPPAKVERLALRNRVGRAYVLDPTDLPTLRKCLAHVGPVAFSMACPWWLGPLGLNKLLSRRATDAAVQELLASEAPSAFTAEQRRFLRLLPALSDVAMTFYRNGVTPKQQGVVITRWFHTHRLPLSWARFPHRPPPPFTAEQTRRFNAALDRHFNALDAASRRELARLPYPHAEEARHIRALEAADGLYAKAQRAMQLSDEYGLRVVLPDRALRAAAADRPAVRDAVDYFKHQVNGGHAMVLVGYDDARREFTVRNSWGENFGDHGHFYLSYDFFSAATDNALRPNHRWLIDAVCVAHVELAPPSSSSHAPPPPHAPPSHAPSHAQRE